MRSLLFGVNPVHPGVISAALGMIVSVIMLASVIPSRRASLVASSDALRAE